MTRRESYEILTQQRINSVSATSIYSPAADEQVMLRELKVCNVSGLDGRKFTVYLDVDGSTYDETTAIYWEVELNKGETWEIGVNLPMYNPSGNIAVKSSVANALTYTLSGEKIIQ
jgi:hypothetical protein